MGEVVYGSCQHHLIGMDTGRCVACGERMISVQVNRESVLSAPNLAGCTIPDCPGYPENPGCENPAGVYVPGRAEEVTVGYKTTYECRRCQCNGDTFVQGEEPVWDCGHVHEADLSPARPS